MLATGVRRVAGHPRPVDVVIAQCGHRRPRLARERGTQVLLVQLRRRVDVAGIQRGVLSHRARGERRSAVRAGRLEAAGLQVVERAGTGPHVAVLGARVAPLAVDDHAACEHEAPADAGGGELAQQDRGAQVVVADVVDDVAEVDAEPDHRRLVADVIDAGQATSDDRGVAHVTVDPLRARVQVVRPSRVSARQQSVEADHVVARVEQRVDDVRPDEPRGAGDEDPHGRSTRIARAVA